MAWNEPGDKGRDPWGGGNKNDGPPDLDDALKQLNDRLRGLFGGGSSNGGKGGSGSSMGIVGLVIAVVVLLWGASGIYQVNEQERGVVLRLGMFHEVVGPGLQWNPPLIDDVTIENVTNLRPHRTSGRMLTKDLNLVEVSISVQYRISDIQNFVLKVDNPERSLREATDSALRQVIGATDMDAVLTDGRAAIATEARVRLQELMEVYATGIEVTKVAIEQSEAPADVRDAFNDVSRALEDRDRLRQEAEAYALGIVPIARGQAQRVYQESEAYRDRVIAEAEGETARFNALLVEYQRAPEVTRQRLYIDMMQDVLGDSNKVLIDVEGGNNMMYLPLDRLMQSNAPRLNLSETSMREAQATLESLRTQPTEVPTNTRGPRR
ncbi:FtsH protease activity modulator HflK [Umboniibacter marinipuniceus]|uniref:Protein HflK n=1 Tax=Umboniibacter marinipuniceus TaxID=569599 RepID=A0A3M0AF02_9GAMM|nr:FtsH protease activity modulator HflK [Umboniibacter marinipuniceus]RMA82269.1 protease FtsH subunit HflK [Umboniibacter marinipuniceus]